MYTENQIQFNDELINKLGFYLWMHSLKCKRIRIGFYIAMAISFAITFVCFLRKIVLGNSGVVALLFFLLTLILFLAIVLIWPLVYRNKVINSVQPNVPQIVTMDAHFVNLHTSMSHQQYKWHNFVDIENDRRYYILFAPDVYIILDKKTFPAGGEEVFRSLHTPARLLKEAQRKSKHERYLMIFTGDYLTPLVNWFNRTFRKNR